MGEKIFQGIILAIVGIVLFFIIGSILVKFLPWIVAGLIVLFIISNFVKGPDKRKRM